MSDTPRVPLGSICHIEIPAPDLDLAQAFFSRLFAWEITPMGPDYRLFQVAGSGGGLDKKAPVADGGPVPVIAVEDVTAKLREIEAAGGTALSEKIAISEGHGYCAYFRDPNGNKLGLWEPPA